MVFFGMKEHPNKLHNSYSKSLLKWNWRWYGRDALSAGSEITKMGFTYQIVQICLWFLRLITENLSS
jgi:hypothetical protein